MADRLGLEDFKQHFGGLTELSSVALGGSIVSCSDEFFAPASDLLKVKIQPAVSMKGQFGPQGALFDGWETRRHNPTFDWAIIRLGASGSVEGFDIDTANFNGNEGPAASVEAISASDYPPTVDDPAWQEILPKSPLGPSSQHLFKLAQPTEPITHLKLCMHPDGGIARFRVYGKVIPAPPAPEQQLALLDLAHVLNGGRVVSVSDQHFGVGPNLLLPGRGVDMGDGWETKRSRAPGHHDWAIIRLGAPGLLESTEIDTLHFVGNFPESCELLAANCGQVEHPPETTKWQPILARVKLGPHQQHFFQLEPTTQPITHVKLIMHPDGGIKRIRLYGRRGSATSAQAANARDSKAVPELPTEEPAQPGQALAVVPSIPTLPLTAAGFSAYGYVIESFARSTPLGSLEDDERSIRAGTRGGVVIKTVNFGTARKFNNLAPVAWVPPTVQVEPVLNQCIFRCDRQTAPSHDGVWPIEALERHQYSSQSFVPINGSQPGRYLVVVALPHPTTGQPDPATLRSFVASPHQGISYHPNVWHHPLIALDEGQTDKLEFVCSVFETGKAEIDCELLQFEVPLASTTLHQL